MATARRRRAAQSDDLINAILAAKGRSLAYRPDWYQTVMRWVYFDDPPEGADRVASMSPPFDGRAQLSAWREAQLEYERAHRRPVPAE